MAWTGCARALSPDVPADDIARGLERTFTALFLGAGGPESLPPYESAHVSHSGLLFQEATGEMQQLLSRLGMSVERRCKEPPDHLAIEVATLAQLLRLRAKSDSQRIRRNSSGICPPAVRVGLDVFSAVHRP